MIRQRGFTLIELLMVLVGIAVILLFSIHRYRIYQRSIEMTGIENDVKRVQQALNRYYHIEGCNSQGIFPANKRSPSMLELGLNVPGRPPVVPMAGDAYTARVIDTGQKTTPSEKGDVGKPVYALRVQAKLNDRFTDKEMMWYQKALNAESASAHTLTWTVLPGNTATAPGTQLWVLKSGTAQFRNMENKLREKWGPAQPANTSSYCAH